MAKCRTLLTTQDAIIGSLLRLLRSKTLDAVSVTEIVEKAGVNRSSYYRHFQTKRDVIRCFYEARLDEYLAAVDGSVDTETYFAGMFREFLRYKEALLLLDREGLSYMLLEVLNDRIPASSDAVSALYANYHIGGVFNAFRYWLRGGMEISPEKLAQQCVQILPADFAPKLLPVNE